VEKRRQFLKKIFGFVAGMSISLTPALALVKTALANSARIILPKGTKRETLIDKHPADLDATHLQVTPLEDFGTMGVSDHAENIEKWRLQVTAYYYPQVETILSSSFVFENLNICLYKLLDQFPKSCIIGNHFLHSGNLISIYINDLSFLSTILIGQTICPPR
jgi:hypothetical protein